jgi:hypothetical protein
MPGHEKAKCRATLVASTRQSPVAQNTPIYRLNPVSACDNDGLSILNFSAKAEPGLLLYPCPPHLSIDPYRVCSVRHPQ